VGTVRVIWVGPQVSGLYAWHVDEPLAAEAAAGSANKAITASVAIRLMHPFRNRIFRCP
jgi:hypothetical protein